MSIIFADIRRCRNLCDAQWLLRGGGRDMSVADRYAGQCRLVRQTAEMRGASSPSQARIRHDVLSS